MDYYVLALNIIRNYLHINEVITLDIFKLKSSQFSFNYHNGLNFNI